MSKELPKGWKWVKLGDSVHVLDNLRKPINSSERKRRIAGKRKDELFPYYGATGQVGWIDNFLTEGEYVLVGEDGAPFLDNFKEKAYKIKGKTWVNNHAHILQEVQNITVNDFILHYLNSINYRQYVNGTTRLKLTKGSLVEIPFPVPSLSTQLAIVSKIEKLFSEIDKGIEQLKTAQQQLKTYRQSVLKWAFEGKLTNGLNHDLHDLPDEHDLSIAAEPETEYKVEGNHGNQANQKNHGSDKGELPQGWKWVKIGEICKCIVPNRDKPKSFTGDIKWITTPNLQENSIRINYEDINLGLSESEAKEYNARVIPVGSVIMTCVGTFGLSAIVEKPIVINQQLHAFITNDKVNPKYLAYCIQFNKYYFESKSTSTTIQYLNKTNCNSMLFPLCAIEEQIYIVQAIESRLSVANKMEESINQSLQQVEALKQSILKKAFEGKLVNEKQVPGKIIPIQRKVLASWIIHLNYDHKYFGLTKFQKTLYLCEQYAQVEYETNYEQERAGPYDREFTLAFRKEIIEKDIFQEETKVSVTHFIPGLHAGIYSKDYPKYFRNKGNKIKFVLQLLKDKTLDEAELIATIYAVWNNMIILKKAYDISAIIEAVYNWSPEKIKYSKKDISSTAEWMKEKNLVPIGFGKIIK